MDIGSIVWEKGVEQSVYTILDASQDHVVLEPVARESSDEAAAGDASVSANTGKKQKVVQSDMRRVPLLELLDKCEIKSANVVKVRHPGWQLAGPTDAG